jgi:hypothetical protein
MPLPKITPIEWNETGKNVAEQHRTLPKISTVEYPKKILSHSLSKKLITWDISKLETRLISCNLPEIPVKLDQCTLITDILLFIESHISTVKAQNGNPCYMPYLERLNRLIDLITVGQN